MEKYFFRLLVQLLVLETDQSFGIENAQLFFLYIYISSLKIVYPLFKLRRIPFKKL